MRRERLNRSAVLLSCCLLLVLAVPAIGGGFDVTQFISDQIRKVEQQLGEVDAAQNAIDDRLAKQSLRLDELVKMAGAGVDPKKISRGLDEVQWALTEIDSDLGGVKRDLDEIRQRLRRIRSIVDRMGLRKFDAALDALEEVAAMQLARFDAAADDLQTLADRAEALRRKLDG